MAYVHYIEFYLFLVCPILPPLENGEISPASVTQAPSAPGTVATYTCNSPYHIANSGSQVRTISCVDNSPTPVWVDPPTPTCVRGKPTQYDVYRIIQICQVACFVMIYDYFKAFF